MRSIRLLRSSWAYDPSAPLGREGGFGVVFAGTGEGYGRVAIKRLKVEAEAAAHRELRIAEELAGRQLEHVIPVLDSGLDAESDSYFVVMAMAEKSLQDEIDSRRRFSDAQSAEVLLQIASGLSEVPEIVHRDLKPNNVLYHEGRWKIADFGIARFVEESTSIETLKGCLTPAYAAPEQWRNEHATRATDIYALACIAHALVRGLPPFRGPSVEDYRRQHLTESPPELAECAALMRSLVSSMLRKPSESRPSLERVRELCRRIGAAQDPRNPGVGVDALARVDAEAAESRVAQEAVEAVQTEELKRRKAIAETAKSILEHLLQRLADEVTALAPTAIVSRTREDKLPFLWWIPWLSPGVWRMILLDLEKPFVLKVSFRDVTLEAHYFTRPETPLFSHDRRIFGSTDFHRSGWDVILGARLALNKGGAERYSVSLWYTNLGRREDHRWYEVGYSQRRWFGTGRVVALDPTRADKAAAGRGRYTITFGPEAIDDEDADSFRSRWLGLVSECCVG